LISKEFRDRLVERSRLAGAELNLDIVEGLDTYYRLLVQWNEKLNLTGLPLNPITDQAVDRLFVEPLAAARYVPKSSLVWFDVGSGGGSPALPLKIARPLAELTMVESKSRKAAFLREAVRALNLRNASVEGWRFEDFAKDSGRRRLAELITIRAVKLTDELVWAILSMLRSQGSVFLFGSSGVSLPPGLALVEKVQLIETVQMTQQNAILAILKRVSNS
jgi:16S rRNA (guanine527-N7)-methyltransferase